MPPVKVALPHFPWKKFTKAKPAGDGTVQAVDLAIPVFDYQSHVGIDRGFGLIRTWKATNAAAY